MTTQTTLEKTTTGFDVLVIYGRHTWADAMALPEKLKGAYGIDDWTLPNKEVLVALQSQTNNAEGWHWSSSPVSGYPDGAWSVYFDYGADSSGNKSSADYVRLVRSSQCLGIWDAYSAKVRSGMGGAA